MAKASPSAGYDKLVARMHEYIPGFDEAPVREAFEYAAGKHKGQKRKSGEAFMIHPVEVARVLAEMEIEPVSIVVALLHDVVEDTGTGLKDIEERFGSTVAQLVNGVTKLDGISFHSRTSAQAENFRKFIVAMAGDIRVLLIKLADRLHNMRTLDALPEEARRRISLETLDVYTPLAHRLGIGRLKIELEELSFRSLEPDVYASVSRQVEAKRKVDEAFIDKVTQTLKGVLEKNGIRARIEGRVKSIFSIHRKLQRQLVALDQVYDYLAYRVITPLGSQEGKDECYRIMGLLHGAWTPVPGRFKDFIAIPKPNGYQSLHTTLMTAEGHPFEVQIRTEAMHRIAAEGVAAHWKYKEGGGPSKKDVSQSDEAMYRWLRRTVEWLKDVKDPHDFLESIKGDLTPTKIYVFSPKGDIYDFTHDATPLDFAYRIHTDVGHRCVGAKINGRIAPLETSLQNGDVVEILTSNESRPRKDWLRIVTAPRTKAKIRAWFNQAEAVRSIDVGKEAVAKYFRRHGENFGKVISDESQMIKALKALGLSNLERLYAAVGTGKILPRSVYDVLFPDQSKVGEVKAHTTGSAPPTESILVHGSDDILVNMAHCCKPIPGEDVVGYVTRGRGVSVHRRNCRNIAQLILDPDRRIDVLWDKPSGKKSTISYSAAVMALVEDRPGMLSDMSQTIAGEGCNIRDIRTRKLPMHRTAIKMVLEIADLDQLDGTIKKLEELAGVLEARRT